MQLQDIYLQDIYLMSLMTKSVEPAFIGKCNTLDGILSLKEQEKGQIMTLERKIKEVETAIDYMEKAQQIIFEAGTLLANVDLKPVGVFGNPFKKTISDIHKEIGFVRQALITLRINGPGMLVTEVIEDRRVRFALIVE